jgi:hypothetical protein
MSDTAPCRGLCGRLLPRSGRNVYAIDGTYPFCAPCARERGLAVPDLAVAAAPKPTMPFAELAAADESSPEPDPEPELEPEDVDPTTLLVTGALIVCNQTRIRVEAADDVSWRITLVRDRGQGPARRSDGRDRPDSCRPEPGHPAPAPRRTDRHDHLQRRPTHHRGHLTCPAVPPVTRPADARR